MPIPRHAQDEVVEDSEPEREQQRQARKQQRAARRHIELAPSVIELTEDSIAPIRGVSRVYLHVCLLKHLTSTFDHSH